MLTSSSVAQPNTTDASAASVSATALAYFDEIHDRSFDYYLRAIRPARLSPELKVRVMSILRKEDIVAPSAEGRAKLAALESVLQFQGRGSVIDPIVIRVGQAVVMFLAGAAVLISEEALDMLTAEELQAVVAHELGHEYFWSEFEEARLNKHYEKIQELELRCDGLAVITMSRLGLDPSNFISAISKLTKSHSNQVMHAEYYLPLKERIKFIRAMIGMVKARERALGPVARK